MQDSPPSRALAFPLEARSTLGFSTENFWPRPPTIIHNLHINNANTTMGLADYLAKNYLSADAKASKKRKRKDAAKEAGVTIADDDAREWTNTPQNADEDDEAPTIWGDTLAGGINKPAKKSKWIRVGTSAPTSAEQASADAILAEAQAESKARAEEDDDAPAIVGEDEGPTMASGAMAGLQTADQVTAALKKKEKAERKAMQAAGLDPTGKAQETIYRDASGRIINVAMKRAEARAKAEEEERKKAAELESRKGEVQKREKEVRKQQLEDAKVMSVARYADDEKMNEELKGRERWNDPMAQLIASKKTGGAAKGGGGKKRGGGKTYVGAFEPNRYGIRPGWRWDGVDRSNGFERKWFAARNRQRNREELEYSWQMDE